jgi:hypothetical protein
MAIGKPPSMGIDRTTALIHSKLAEVTSEAMVQLHKRNQRIEITVQESQITIEESHSTIQRLESMLEEAKLENENYRRQEESQLPPFLGSVKFADNFCLQWKDQLQTNNVSRPSKAS